MINIDILKDVQLNSQEIYDVINEAIEEAEDSGFLNAFVYERSLIIHLVLLLIQDIEEEDKQSIVNPLQTFDNFIKKGYIDLLMQKYAITIDYVTKVAATWYQDYEKYLLSIGGTLNRAEVFSENNMTNVSNQFKELLSNDAITESIRIAEEWGLNRQPKVEEKEVQQPELTLL